MKNLWYVETNHIGWEQRKKNLWYVEEDGDSDDRKKVSEETATVWSGVDQDLIQDFFGPESVFLLDQDLMKDFLGPESGFVRFFD